MGIFKSNAGYGSSDGQSQLGPAIIVHNLDQTEIAMKTISVTSIRTVLLSAENAAEISGSAVFYSMINQAFLRNPHANFVAILDCGGNYGAALEAIRTGADYISFAGAGEVTAKIKNIAAQLNVSVIKRPTDYLDLNTATNHQKAVQTYLANKPG